MKLPKQVSRTNPLQKILWLFTDQFEDLSLDNLQDTAELLRSGEILCEEYSEVFACLELLEKMNLLALEEVIDKQTGYASYKIKRTYET